MLCSSQLAALEQMRHGACRMPTPDVTPSTLHTAHWLRSMCGSLILILELPRASNHLQANAAIGPERSLAPATATCHMPHAANWNILWPVDAWIMEHGARSMEMRHYALTRLGWTGADGMTWEAWEGGTLTARTLPLVPAAGAI